MAKRYYLHGDQHKDNPDLYYCRACDLFEKAEHFVDALHKGSHIDRYRKSLSLWKSYKPGGYERPSDSFNLVATGHLN